MLDETTARGIIKDVTKNMKYWENMAEDIGLPPTRDHTLYESF